MCCGYILHGGRSWVFFSTRIHVCVDEAPAAKKKEDVHVPAKNIGDIKSAEKVKLVLSCAIFTLVLLSNYKMSSVYTVPTCDTVHVQCIHVLILQTCQMIK